MWPELFFSFDPIVFVLLQNIWNKWSTLATVSTFIVRVFAYLRYIFSEELYNLYPLRAFVTSG
jgi:hypothetical protein